MVAPYQIYKPPILIFVTVLELEKYHVLSVLSGCVSSKQLWHDDLFSPNVPITSTLFICQNFMLLKIDFSPLSAIVFPTAILIGWLHDKIS